MNTVMANTGQRCTEQWAGNGVFQVPVSPTSVGCVVTGSLGVSHWLVVGCVGLHAAG